MKRQLSVLAVVVSFLAGAISIPWGCKSPTPTSPYDKAFSPTPTPIVRVIGSVQVAVQDKGQAVVGLTVNAIPPSGVPTYSAATTTTGIATFDPPYLEVGPWKFVISQQAGFPFAPSTLTMPVSVANQMANFNSAGATIQLTPPVPAAYTGTNGGVFVYGLSYTQPGSLLVPIKLGFPAFPANWSVSWGPATFGYVPVDTSAVTISGASCVDRQPSFAVTAMDLEATPFPRITSGPQTITKNFTSNVTVSWSSPNYSSIANCNVERRSNAGVLTVSITNSCATVDVWVNEPSTNCTSGSWNTPNGNTNATGSHITFGAGTYSCTYTSDGGFPVISASCNATGLSGGVQVGNGSFTILNTSY